MAAARHIINEEHLFKEVTDNLTSSSNITTEDVIKELTALGADLSVAIPQFNYAGFSIYSILIPELLTAIKGAIALPQPTEIGLAWNIADGILQIIYGSVLVYSVVKGDTHTPIATGVEGGMNILGGSQLIIFTAISLSNGAIAFAVAFAVASAFSIKNAIESARKSFDDDYWIQDSLEVLTLSRKKHSEELLAKHEQVDRIRKNIADEQKIRDNMNELNNAAPTDKKLPQETLNFVTDTTLRFITDRLKNSKQHIEDLQTEIFARLVTDYVEKGVGSNLFYNHLIDFEQFTESQQKCLEEIKAHVLDRDDNNNYKSKEERIDFVNTSIIKHNKEPHTKGQTITPYEKCVSITQVSKEECKKDTIRKILDSLFMILADAGMVCLCFPGAQPLAPFFIAPAVGYFIPKLGVQFASVVGSIHSFFSKEHTPENTEQPDPQPDNKNSSMDPEASV